MGRHNVWIPEELWERASTVARKLSVEEDQQVSVSELIRRGLTEEIEAYERRQLGD